MYTITLDTKENTFTTQCRTCPEDPAEHAYYSASFSSKFGYYVLNYEGPNVPSMVVKSVENSFTGIVQNNTELKELLSDYAMPRSRKTVIKSGGVELNAMELLPPDFDISQKYPVLFNVYGGPGSQLVSYQFQLDWHIFLASKLKYIVVTVIHDDVRTDY